MSGRANAGERRTATGVSDPAKSVISFKIILFGLRTPCLYVSHISRPTLRRIAVLSDFPTVGADFSAFHQTTDEGEQALIKNPKVEIDEHRGSMVFNIVKNSLEIRLDLRMPPGRHIIIVGALSRS